MSSATKHAVRAARVAGRAGFALSHVLIAASMLAAIALAIASSNGESSTHSFLVGVKNDLQNQARIIRQQVLRCVLSYPTPSGPFPLPWPSEPASGLVSDLVCPNAPAGRQDLWAGHDGIFLPGPPNGFGAWRYSIDGTRIEISIDADAGVAGDISYQRAVEGVAEKFSAAEASFATGAGSASFTLVLRN